jgi:long-chain acyl-CoA synthetase
MSITNTIDFTRVFDLLEYQERKYPQVSSLTSWHNGAWNTWSTRQAIERVDQISCWLLSQGYQKGDCLAVIPKMGSAQWMILDFACQQIGVITVPLHPTASVEEMIFILNEVKCVCCITLDEILFEKLERARPSCPSIRQAFHLNESRAGYFPAFNFTEVGSSLTTSLQRIKNEIRPEDTLAILYTSGTSGTPKGAILSHRNVVANIKSILPIFPLNAGERVLSFLPFSHIFERTSSYSYLAFGASIYFARSREQINDDFKFVRPVFCTCVPKTLEKMYEYLEEKQVNSDWLTRKVIAWAMSVGEKFHADGKVRPLLGLQLAVARLLVLNRWKKALGGKIKFTVVGAAALRPEIGRLFSAANVKVLAGYGMTEASPFIAVNRPEPGLNKFGTVGLPVPGVEVKIENPSAEGEGEILVKGDNVVSGYFNRPDLNAEVFADGWLHTGDVGKIIHKRFLMITDRKKDIFKTTAGIYVAPQVVENLLCSSSFITQCFVVGFNRPHVLAVVVPHFVLLQRWCTDNGIHWTSPPYMIHNIKVIQKMQEEIDRLNQEVESHQRIRKFVLTDFEWTTENGLLTTSLKPIRAKLAEHYKAQIEKAYEE